MQLLDITESSGFGSLWDVTRADIQDLHHVRNPGMHLGDIIHRMQRAWEGKGPEPLEDRQYREQLSDSQRDQFEKGFIWEDVFAWMWLKRIERAINAKAESPFIMQQEIQLDSVYMTPDMLQAIEWFLFECKFTVKSMTKLDALEKYFPHWLVQIKGYLHGLGMTRCVLAVFCACGDYRPPFPTVRVLQLDFNERELVENWQNVIRMRDKMLQEQQEGVE